MRPLGGNAGKQLPLDEAIRTEPMVDPALLGRYCAARKLMPRA
jgi:hypothetical protein